VNKGTGPLEAKTYPHQAMDILHHQPGPTSWWLKQ